MEWRWSTRIWGTIRIQKKDEECFGCSSGKSRMDKDTSLFKRHQQQLAAEPTAIAPHSLSADSLSSAVTQDAAFVCLFVCLLVCLFKAIKRTHIAVAQHSVSRWVSECISLQEFMSAVVRWAIAAVSIYTLYSFQFMMLLCWGFLNTNILKTSCSSRSCCCCGRGGGVAVEVQ